MRTPTPRPQRVARPQNQIGTLIGNGWLREAPRNIAQKGWDIRGRSALRKCVFMQMPPGLLEALPPPPPRDPVFAANYAQRIDAAIESAPAPRARNLAREAREFPQFPNPAQRLRRDAKRPVSEDDEIRAVREKIASPWWEDPIALGSLLILMPPIGLAAVWSSKRYSSDARWALTVMTALMMCLVASVSVAALALG